MNSINEATIPTKDIQHELERRQQQERQSLFTAIREHQSAIEVLEHRLATLEQMKVPEPSPAPEQPQPHLPAPQRLEPQFGPCATRILELLEASRVPLSETELLRCTRYSTVMFRKATAELMGANKVIRKGEPRKPAYLTAPPLRAQ